MGKGKARRRKRKRRPVRQRAARRSASRPDEGISIKLPVPSLPAELRGRLRRTSTPTHPVSDALIEVARPFIEFPPRPDDLDGFLDGLALVAAVWNAAIAPTAELRNVELDEVARSRCRDEDPATSQALMRTISNRKLELFPDDLRFIAEVRVEARDGGRQAFVEAVSAYLDADA